MLTWNAAAGANTYTIFRSTSSPASDELASSISDTTYTDDTISSGVRYYYRVQAVNTGGISAFSNEANAESAGPPPVIALVAFNPERPSPTDEVIITASITDSDGSVSQAQIAWAIDGTSQMNITMDMPSANTFEGVIPAQPAGAAITFVIEATDNSGNLSRSTESGYIVNEAPVIERITFTPSSPLPSEQVSVTAVIQDAGTITEARIEWRSNGINQSDIFMAQGETPTIWDWHDPRSTQSNDG